MAAPAPTELLAGDIQDLRESLRQISSDVGSLKTDFSGFRASVETQLSLIKWVGVFFATVLVAMVASAVTVAWHASAFVSEIRQQGARLEQQGVRLERVDQQLGQLVQAAAKGGVK